MPGGPTGTTTQRAGHNRYSATMNFGLALLETERELPIPAWGFGLIAFVILHLLLFITISIGKGRPHS